MFRQVFNKYPASCWTRMYITVFITPDQLFLSWVRSSQSTPFQPGSSISIEIFSSHQILGLPSGLFPSGIPTKTLQVPLLCLIRATSPASLPCLSYNGKLFALKKTVNFNRFSSIRLYCNIPVVDKIFGGTDDSEFRFPAVGREVGVPCWYD